MVGTSPIFLPFFFIDVMIFLTWLILLNTRMCHYKENRQQCNWNCATPCVRSYVLDFTRTLMLFVQIVSLPRKAASLRARYSRARQSPHDGRLKTEIAILRQAQDRLPPKAGFLAMTVFEWYPLTRMKYGDILPTDPLISWYAFRYPGSWIMNPVSWESLDFSPSSGIIRLTY